MNEAQFHSRLEWEFADLLRQKGYPQNSIIFEPALRADGHEEVYRPDFLIIDPHKNERLAVVEVKGSLHNIKRTRNQLRAYARAIGNEKIPIFLVSPSNEEQAAFPFQLHIFDDEENLRSVDFSFFPTFEALSAEETAERKSDIRNRRLETSNYFQRVSWSLAVFLLSLAAADFVCAQFGIILVTPERMALVGGAVALVVIPFAQKFKGLGIEWEKATREKVDAAENN